MLCLHHPWLDINNLRIAFMIELLFFWSPYYSCGYDCWCSYSLISLFLFLILMQFLFLSATKKNSVTITIQKKEDKPTAESILKTEAFHFSGAYLVDKCVCRQFSGVYFMHKQGVGEANTVRKTCGWIFIDSCLFTSFNTKFYLVVMPSKLHDEQIWLKNGPCHLWCQLRRVVLVLIGRN